MKILESWKVSVDILILFITSASSSDQISMHNAKLASCYYACGAKYGVVRSRILQSGERDDALDVNDNANFTLCEWGCLQPNVNDTMLQPFLEGQKTMHNAVLVQTNTLDPPSKVELLCADAAGVGLMKGKVVVQPSKRKVSLELYIVEILKKNYRDDEVIDVVYVFSRETTVLWKSDRHAFGFRVTTLVSSGKVYNISAHYCASPWYFSGEWSKRPLKEFYISRHKLENDSVSAVVTWSTSEGMLHSCTVVFRWIPKKGFPITSTFEEDRTRSYTIKNLNFDTQYAVEMYYSKLESFWVIKGEFFTPMCYQLADNISGCPPPPVHSLHYTYNGASRSYYISWGYDYEDYERSARLVEFLVVLKPVMFLADCISLSTQFFVLPQNQTWFFAQAYEKCHFDVEITVRDRDNRTSVRRTISLRYEPDSTTKYESEPWRNWMEWLFFLVLFILGCCLQYFTSKCESDRFVEARCYTPNCYVEESISRRATAATVTTPHEFTSSDRALQLENDSPSKLDQILEVFAANITFRTPSDIVNDSCTSHDQKIRLVSRQSSVIVNNAAPNSSCKSSSEWSASNGFTLKKLARKVAFLSLGDVKVIDTAGKGIFGAAHIVCLKRINQFALFKAVRCSAECDGDKMNLRGKSRTAVWFCASGHDYIVKLIGLCFDKPNPTEEVRGLLFEYCEDGDLKSYLRKLRGEKIEVNQRLAAIITELYQFSYQIANALVYISQCGYVHCDIAARNVWLFREVSGGVFRRRAKIAGFDLCRDVTEVSKSNAVEEEDLRMKWLPCEYWVDREYGYEGDIWEYGCLLIEIMTLGNDPEIMVEHKVRGDFVQYLEHLTSGISALDDHFQTSPLLVMRQCLNTDKTKRPNFQEICSELMNFTPHSVLPTRNNSLSTTV